MNIDGNSTAKTEIRTPDPGSCALQMNSLGKRREVRAVSANDVRQSTVLTNPAPSGVAGTLNHSLSATEDAPVERLA